MRTLSAFKEYTRKKDYKNMYSICFQRAYQEEEV